MVFKPEAQEEIQLCKDLGLERPHEVTKITFTIRPGHFTTATVELQVSDEVAARLFNRAWDNKKVVLDPVPKAEL